MKPRRGDAGLVQATARAEAGGSAAALVEARAAHEALAAASEDVVTTEGACEQSLSGDTV